MASKVSIVKCDDYDPGRVEAAVRQSVELAGGLDGFVRKGKKVLLKVNLTQIRPPDSHIITHPSVVLAVVKMLQELGAEVVIGESISQYIWDIKKKLNAVAREKLRDATFDEISSIFDKFHDAESIDEFLAIKLRGDDKPLFNICDLNVKGINDEIFSIVGLSEIREKTGAKLVIFDNAGWVELQNPGGTFLKKVWLTRVPIEADAIISLPKLKTHDNMLYTGAIKNSLGMVPGRHKSKYHAASKTASKMGEMLVDIFQLVKPQFAIMDGIIGMEENGPIDGPIRKIGIIAAGADSVALDAVCSSVINYDPLEIATTRIAAERGLGEAGLGKIEVAGTPIEEVRIRDFKRPNRVTYW